MNRDLKLWIEQQGLRFIKELGITAGHIVVDFGCGTGHYSIPASKVVGFGGMVYAIDQERTAIEQLMEIVQFEGLDNIVPIVSRKLTINLSVAFVDAVLLYDVLHYLSDSERQQLYQSVNTVLRNGGILSVFPKHNRLDFPMWHLKELNIDDIVHEIEQNHFVLVQKYKKRLIHDDYINTGIILNFKKF